MRLQDRAVSTAIDLFKLSNDYLVPAVAEDIQYIKRQIEREMDHLKDLYTKVSKIEGKTKPRKDRIKKLEQELHAKNPSARVDKELLGLVGTDPPYIAQRRQGSS
jgi:predicted  nucleic acid-binding Zn-ribbon protein